MQSARRGQHTDHQQNRVVLVDQSAGQLIPQRGRDGEQELWGPHRTTAVARRRRGSSLTPCEGAIALPAAWPECTYLGDSTGKYALGQVPITLPATGTECPALGATEGEQHESNDGESVPCHRGRG